LQFQWNPFVLRASLLRVTGLDLRGLDVALASAEAPEPTEEPGDLRATLDTVFSLPLDFLVDQARLRDLVLAMGDTRVEVGEISATALSLDGSGFSAGELRVQAEGYEAAAADLALSAEDLVLGGRLDWRVALPE